MPRSPSAPVREWRSGERVGWRRGASPGWQSREAGMEQNRIRILNVDDDDAMRRLKAAWLEDEGCEVIDAVTGTEALALAIEFAPEVVLLDINLPDIDGYAVCERLRAFGGDPAAIVHVTAMYVSPDDWRRSVECGADSYLIQPTEPAVLLRTIRTVLQRRSAELAARRERDRLLAEQRELASLYSSIIDQSLAGVYIVQDERFRFVNQAFCEILQESSLALRDAPTVFDLMHEADRAEARRLFDACANGERSSIRPVFRMRRGDGGWAQLQAHTARGLFSGRPALVGVALDVTHRAELEAQLRQSQKMEAIGQLAGGIAHDFNNLLTAILGYAELMYAQIDSEKPIHGDLREITRAAQSAAELTRKLLAFSRKQGLNLRRLDLAQIARALEPMLRRVLDDRIAVQLQADGAVW